MLSGRALGLHGIDGFLQFGRQLLHGTGALGLGRQRRFEFLLLFPAQLLAFEQLAAHPLDVLLMRLSIGRQFRQGG